MKLTSSEVADQLFGCIVLFQGQPFETHFSSGAGRVPIRADSELKRLCRKAKMRKCFPYCNEGVCVAIITTEICGGFFLTFPLFPAALSAE